MTGRSACSPSISLHHQLAVARFAHSDSDGGGIRGLSELVVLEETMNRIKYDLDVDGDLLPADFFDLIGGTSHLREGKTTVAHARLGRKLITVMPQPDCAVIGAGRVASAAATDGQVSVELSSALRGRCAWG
ncbi:hypothetical protein VTK26DRAFT_7396 [Humicola hyalothermophila]